MADQSAVIKVASVAEEFKEVLNQLQWDAIGDGQWEGPDDDPPEGSALNTVSPVIVIPIDTGNVL